MKFRVSGPTVCDPSPTLTQFCAQIKTLLQYSADLTKAETLSERLRATVQAAKTAAQTQKYLLTYFRRVFP